MCLSGGLLWKSCVACLLARITHVSVTQHLHKGESIGSENTAALSGCLNTGWMASEAQADQRDICFLASLTIWVSTVLSVLTTHTTLCLTNRLLTLSTSETGSSVPHTGCQHPPQQYQQVQAAGFPKQGFSAGGC